MVHTFDHSTQEEEAGFHCEYKASLVYSVSPGQPGLCYTEKPYLKIPKEKKFNVHVQSHQTRANKSFK